MYAITDDDNYYSDENEEEKTSKMDGESGEITTRKICVLRKIPKRNRRKTKCNKSPLIRWDHFPSCPFVRERNFSQRLRIQSSMTGLNINMEGETQIVHHQRSYSAKFTPKEPIFYMYWGTYEERPIFRVPGEYFKGTTGREADMIRTKEAQCINIWEEFIYGTSAVNKSYIDSTFQEEDKSFTASLKRYLGRFLSDNLVNIFIYLVHSIIYLFSMYFYNLIWSCFGYILLDGHIRIHERAYKLNANLVFGGSIFQGPAYVLVRNWCEHCQQKETERMFIRLMVKMKSDILQVNRQHNKPIKQTHIQVLNEK